MKIFPINTYHLFISNNTKVRIVPRKGYKVITVKEEAFYKFYKAVQSAKRADPNMDNSKFVEWLLENKKKKQKSS